MDEEDGRLSFLGLEKGNGNDESPLLEEARRQIEEYLDGKRMRFELPFAIEATPFALRVYEKAQAVPYGETTTYASLLGHRYARAVGMALGKNPIALIVPCHRIVGKRDLGGYRYRKEVKKRLLMLEKARKKPSGNDR